MTDNSTPTTPAGWYPDTRPGAPAGAEMYWDGTTWRTDMLRTAAEPTAATAAVAVAEEPAKRPWYKRKAIIIPAAVVGGIIVLSGIINGVSGGAPDPVADRPAATDGGFTQESKRPEGPVMVNVPAVTGRTVSEARAQFEEAGLIAVVPEGVGEDWIITSTDLTGQVEEGTSVTIAAEAPVPPMTVAQESAIRSAESYLSFKGFSRAGLFQQLTSEYGEGFEAADAEFAIATLEQTGKVDWNQEAVQSAESYLEFKGFSRDGLFQQLTSEYGEGFTADQANFALDQVGL